MTNPAGRMKNMERLGATTLRGNPMTLLGPELKVGDKAPDFDTVDNSMKPVTLATTGNGVRIFSVVTSLDSPVRDAQTKRFNDEAGKLPSLTIYTFNLELPFPHTPRRGGASRPTATRSSFPACVGSSRDTAC